MRRKRPAKGKDTNPNRYIVYKGKDAETLQFWEHDHHDRRSAEGTEPVRSAGTTSAIGRREEGLRSAPRPLSNVHRRLRSHRRRSIGSARSKWATRGEGGK